MATFSANGVSSYLEITKACFEIEALIYLRSGGSFYKPVFPRSAIRGATFTLNLNIFFVFEAKVLKFCINDTGKVLRYVLKNHENRPTDLGSRHQNVLTLFFTFTKHSYEA